MTTTDFLTGTVKGPGEMPHEYLFITKDNKKTRIGEFVYYAADVGDEKRQIIGTIKGRKLVRNLPDAFLSDPNTPPSLVSSLIGLNGDACEIYEITVETIGYFNEQLKDFVNPRIPPNPGDAIYLASSETLSRMLSPKKFQEHGSAHYSGDCYDSNLKSAICFILKLSLAIQFQSGSKKLIKEKDIICTILKTTLQKEKGKNWLTH